MNLRKVNPSENSSDHTWKKYHSELTKDHVLTSAYVKFLNKSVWSKKDCSWLTLNKHAMYISIQTSTNEQENRKTSPSSPRAPALLSRKIKPFVAEGFSKPN